MLKKHYLYILLIGSLIACKPESQLSETDTKVEALLVKMTLKEKIGQMTQINLTVIAKGPNKWASNDTMEIDIQKAKKDKALINYSKVNLKFDNQVVCTKK